MAVTILNTVKIHSSEGNQGMFTVSPNEIKGGYVLTVKLDYDSKGVGDPQPSFAVDLNEEEVNALFNALQDQIGRLKQAANELSDI